MEPDRHRVQRQHHQLQWPRPLVQGVRHLDPWQIFCVEMLAVNWFASLPAVTFAAGAPREPCVTTWHLLPQGEAASMLQCCLSMFLRPLHVVQATGCIKKRNQINHLPVLGAAHLHKNMQKRACLELANEADNNARPRPRCGHGWGPQQVPMMAC